MTVPWPPAWAEDTPHQGAMRWWVLAAVVLLGLYEGLAVPDYWAKSAVKLVLFALVPLIWLFRAEIAELWGRMEWSKLRVPLLLGALAVPVTYFVLAGVLTTLDTSSMGSAVTGTVGDSVPEYLLTTIYIMAVNSTLEEWFFRGVALRAFGGQSLAARWRGVGVSSTLFALYHVAIIGTWSSPFAVAVTVAGLAVAGVILSWIRLRYGSVAASWLVHASVNLGINLIGYRMLFG